MLEHELEKIKTETGYPLWDFSKRENNIEMTLMI